MLTPIEHIHGKLFAKREDLAFPPPNPPFAKIRGLYPRLVELQQKGVTTVGYMETTISMAGWGVSFVAKKLGMRAVIYKPVYRDKKHRHNQDFQVKMWEKNGAVIKSIQATRLQINWFQARIDLHANYQNAYMLEQGLPFDYTIIEVAKQVTSKLKRFKSIVLCIGSGVMAAGILKGLQEQGLDIPLHGILVAPKNVQKMKEKIYKMAGLHADGLFATGIPQLTILDTGYAYTDKEDSDCPFPCNPYYDRKAWKWCVNNWNALEIPVLFWNIGA